MSNDDLLELWYLPGEIQNLQNEIKRVSGWRVSPDMRSAVTELLDILDQRLNHCQAEYSRCMDFITALPDEWIRTAFNLRYVQRHSWAAVGAEMGVSPDCCRKMVLRYLERHGAGAPPLRGKADGKEAAK